MFGWIANTSRPNKTESWKRSFLDHSESYILFRKQAYKLELFRKWKIHNVFHVSMLKQDTTKKKQVDKKVKQMEFDASDDESGEYEVEAIWDSAVYERESKSGYLPGSLLSGLIEKISRGRKYLETSFNGPSTQKAYQLVPQNHPDKPTATFLAIDTAPPMAKSTIRPPVKSSKLPKQKQRQLANSTNKWAKTNWVAFEFYRVFRQIWVTPILDILSRNARNCTWLYMTSSQPSSKLLSKFRLPQPCKPQL